MFRDVLHKLYGVIVELDGRLFHGSAEQRDADMDRDLDAVLDGQVSLRLGWGQCSSRPCHTAAKTAKVLQAKGWGSPKRCGPGCAVEPPT